MTFWRTPAFTVGRVFLIAVLAVVTAAEFYEWIR